MGSPYFHLYSPGLALSRCGSLSCSSSPLSESALICSSFSPRRFICFVPSGVAISLLTLPVFQGAAVSSERFSQSLPPRNVAELGGSPPLRGSLEQLDRPSPAGPPLQGTELAALSTPETSLERLVPLVDYSAAWKLLPNVSRWVTHTVEQGYVVLCRSLYTGALPCWWVPSRLW